MSSNIKDTLKSFSDVSTVDGTFDITQYSNNLNEIKEGIETKIRSADIRLTALNIKEDVTNKMMMRTSNYINEYEKSANFKLRSQYETIYIKQTEALSLICEMMMKYEDLIFKYRKMLIDIENHKVQSYTKIKAAEKTIKTDEDSFDENYQGTLKEINKLLQDNSSEDNKGNPLLQDIQNELKLEGY